jgi:5-oxoprolinase (ATP-hydrolysing)/N-methylhydantoinase B
MQSGGGYGNPFERDPARVLKDFIDEKIDANHAREAYGVVIDSDTGRIDAEKTRTLRAERR